MTDIWKQIALTMRQNGCSPQSIVLTLQALNAPISTRTIYRSIAPAKHLPVKIHRKLTAMQVGRLLVPTMQFQRIVRGLASEETCLAVVIGHAFDDAPTVEGAEAVWDLTGQYRVQREGRYEDSGDALPEESLAMVYYPQRGRPEGLKVYLKRQKDLNRMEQKMDETWVLTECKVCRTLNDPEYLVDGVCEDCIDEYEEGIFEKFDHKGEADDLRRK